MPLKIAFVMDDIELINTKKDTSFAMMLSAQSRQHQIYYMKINDLSIENGRPFAQVARVKVQDQLTHYYTVEETLQVSLSDMDVIMMRKDPPFDSQFLYATHILELAERLGSLVVNKPRALRDFNEKLFTSLYPDLIPDTLVTADSDKVKAFHAQHSDIICKPLDGMGGTSIFRITSDGRNLGVVTEILTNKGQRHAMFQRFMPQIIDGDKRILIVNGEVMPYCLARLPAKNETRGNLAAGGTGRPQAVSDEDFAVANVVAKDMLDEGLLFVGLDMIGNKITEINITSPTCVREIEAAYDIDICARLFSAIEQKVKK